MTNEHTSLEKYTSHTLFSKGLRKGWYWLCARGELETEQTATYWAPSSSDHSSTSSLFCLAAQPGSWGPKPSVWCWLSLRRLVPNCDWNSNCDCNWNRTLPASKSNCICNSNWTLSATDSSRLWQLFVVHLLPVSERINHVHRSRWYSDILDRMHLLFTQVHLLIDGSVEGQYATKRLYYKLILIFKNKQ